MCRRRREIQRPLRRSDHGFMFRGMVKTCNKAYPKAAGNAHTFTERGETYALETTINGVKHRAVMWGDRKRKVSLPRQPERASYAGQLHVNSVLSLHCTLYFLTFYFPMYDTCVACLFITPLPIL